MKADISRDLAYSIDADQAERTIRSRWITCAKRPIVLFGAGTKGRETLEILSDAGQPVSCFADDTPSKQGSLIQGTPVLSLQEALAFAGGNPTVVICLFTPKHQYEHSAERILREAPDSVTMPFYSVWLACLGVNFHNYFMVSPTEEAKRLPIYSRLHHALVDDESRDVLTADVRLRMLHESPPAPTRRTQLPFLEPVLTTPGLTYVDAGAFDGDTIAEFIEMYGAGFAEIIALEPDIANRLAMHSRLASLAKEIRMRVTIRPEGLWHSKAVIGFDSQGNMGSSIDDSATSRIDVISLDELLVATTGPCYIKLDIEGAEMAALAGASRFMRQQKPAWAISVYHRPGDLADAFNWLSASAHDYKFALRCHGGDGADLVLYAW